LQAKRHGSTPGEEVDDGLAWAAFSSEEVIRPASGASRASRHASTSPPRRRCTVRWGWRTGWSRRRRRSA